MKGGLMTEKDGVYLSKKEQNKFLVITEYINKKMTRTEASLALNCDIRTVTRLARAVREKNLLGVRHGNLGKTPWNKLDFNEEERIKKLVLGPYQNFNILHLHEVLTATKQLKIKYTKLRSICHSIHAVKRAKRRAKPRHYRKRHAAEGYLLQMDGSTHEWILGEKWCLIAAIDDATSDIPYGEFFKVESLAGVMKVLRKIIELRGIPWALYLDKAEWFAGLRPSDKTQFKRICKELGIVIIAAHSPQAKGRIERAWNTMQDRLVAELEFNQIDSMSAATKYLNEVFLAETWKKKMTVLPESSEYLYKPIPINKNLNHIFCLKFTRKVRTDHTIFYKNNRYEITTKLPYSIAKRLIEIRVYDDGSVQGWLNERNLELKCLTNYYGHRYAS
jgi:hypothetical protein